MAAFKGANVTKYDAGGSGDNYIPDGYIKSVEKVWMDTFTFSAVLTTADTVTIAKVPKNKKITGVYVQFPAITPTSSTINVGIAGDATKFIDAPVTGLIDSTAVPKGLQAVSMNRAVGYVTTAETDIILSIGVAAITAPTAGTITTIVKYT